MNALGWLGGAPAPIVVGYAAGVIGLSGALSATSVIYLLVAALLLLGILLTPRARTSLAN
jgi:hypothetical protein